MSFTWGYLTLSMTTYSWCRIPLLGYSSTSVYHVYLFSLALPIRLSLVHLALHNLGFPHFKGLPSWSACTLHSLCHALLEILRVWHQSAGQHSFANLGLCFWNYLLKIGISLHLVIQAFFEDFPVCPGLWGLYFTLCVITLYVTIHILPL